MYYLKESKFRKKRKDIWVVYFISRLISISLAAIFEFHGTSIFFLLCSPLHLIYFQPLFKNSTIIPAFVYQLHLKDVLFKTTKNFFK